MDTDGELSSILKSFWTELLKLVDSSLEEQKEVIIIALSRKMPRVFGLMKQQYLSSDAHSMSILDHCSFSTEHALPFVLNRGNKQTVIILDDIINTGETVQSVVDDVVQLSDIRPYVLSLYKNRESGTLRNVCKESSQEEILKVDIRKKFNLISSWILEYGLPIDMEYPIFHTQRMDEEGFMTKLPVTLKSSFDQCIQYTVNHKTSDNYVVILEEETNKLYNNDFAKLRFYMDGNHFKIVSYAPNVLSEDNLRQEKLFINERYNNLWKIIWNKTNINSADDVNNEAVLYRKYRTLIVWANYLYSLSSFIRKKAKLEKSLGSLNFKVQLEDLCLILGRNMAEEVLPEINSLINENQVSPSTREYLYVPSCLVYPRLQANYTILKYKHVMNAEKIDVALDRIFRLPPLMKKLSDNRYIPEDYKIPVQESFISLFNAFRISYKVDDIATQIYQWIDSKIDEGWIIPRYERVKDSSDNVYWKRYFRYSSLVF